MALVGKARSKSDSPLSQMGFLPCGLLEKPAGNGVMAGWIGWKVVGK